MSESNNGAGLAWSDGRQPKVLCTARRTNGDPCRRPPIKGASVCRTHGGAAPQVKAAARARLDNAADRMARQLLKMADTEGVADSVKLAAIRDALDRAGVSAKTAVEVTVGPTEPWQVVLTEAMGISGGSRAASQASRGHEDTPPRSAEPVIDAEVVEPPDCLGCGLTFPADLPDHLDQYPTYCRACREARGLPDPAPTSPAERAFPAAPLAGEPLRGPAGGTGPEDASDPAAASGGRDPGDGLVTFADAVAAIAGQRNRRSGRLS